MSFDPSSWLPGLIGPVSLQAAGTPIATARSTWNFTGITITDDGVDKLTFAASAPTDLNIASQAQGDILYRNATNWVRLAAGTNGQYLKTQGASANPVWATISTLPSDLNIASQAQGDILYFNGSNWVRLAAGTTGKFLTTAGAGANPSWTTAPLPTDLNIASQAQGDILYFNGSNWVRLAAGTAGQTLRTLGTGANPLWASGLYTYYDKDLTTLSNQTVSADGTLTIDGNAAWRAINSANTTTNTVITNGTGIVVKPIQASDMNGATYTAPTLGVTLASLITNYEAGMRVRVWMRLSQNCTANYDAAIVGLSTYNASVASQLFVAGKFGLSPSGTGAGINMTLNGSATSTYDANGITTDDVVVVDMPDGIFGDTAIIYTGAWSAGWPAVSALHPRALVRTTGGTFATTFGNLRTAADAYLFFGAQRAASGTTLTVTFKNLRVDAK